MDPELYRLERAPLHDRPRWYHRVAKWLSYIIMAWMLIVQLYWFYIWWGVVGLFGGIIVAPSIVIFPLIFYWVTGILPGALTYGVIVLICFGAFWFSDRGKS